MREGGQNGRRVLVAWDGSPAASTAVPVAQRIATQLGTEAEALCVAKDARELADWEASLRDEARRLGVTMRLCQGEPAKEIVRAAADAEVQLVALTTHGREVGSDYRLGSVAEKVVAGTTAPVLIVKPEAAGEAPRPGELKRLLVPIDGTPKTSAALHPVTELAGALHASIDLLYVTDSGQGPPGERGSMTAPRYVDQPQHEWPEWTGEVIHRLAQSCACPKDVPVHIFLAHGDVGEEITRFATENQSDAIVLVRRSRFQPGRAKVIRAVLEGTASYVIVVGGEEK